MVAFSLICSNFLVLCEKSPKDAEDAEVGELRGSAAPHPVRSPVISCIRLLVILFFFNRSLLLLEMFISFSTPLHIMNARKSSPEICARV